MDDGAPSHRDFVKEMKQEQRLQNRKSRTRWNWEASKCWASICSQAVRRSRRMHWRCLSPPWTRFLMLRNGQLICLEDTSSSANYVRKQAFDRSLFSAKPSNQIQSCPLTNANLGRPASQIWKLFIDFPRTW
jgi:hypothetical protein